MYAALRTDLAHRRSDGIKVTLWWILRRQRRGRSPAPSASDSSFELAVDRASARSTPTTTRSPTPPAAAPSLDAAATSAPSHRHRRCASPRRRNTRALPDGARPPRRRRPPETPPLAFLRSTS